MLLGIKSRKVLLARHLFISILLVAFAALFWRLRVEKEPTIRVAVALADAGFVFLFLTLAIGPLAKLWNQLRRLVPWRRELGIWLAIATFLHGLTILAALYGWDLMQVFGFAQALDGSYYYLANPGMGLANTLGLIALWTFILLGATSSDRAVNYLGIGSWKWLHYGAYAAFYLSASHALFHLFSHDVGRVTKLSDLFVNQLAAPFLAMSLIVPALQFAAFVKTVYGHRSAKLAANFPIRRYMLPVVGHRTVAEKTEEVTFSLEGKDFAFVPGQHLQLRIETLKYPDPRGPERIFSIVSSPKNKEHLIVAFRHSGSGFKQTLVEGTPELKVQIEGPFGYFTLPKDEAQPVVLLAGGIGITPCMSMIRYATETKRTTPITLLYANRDRASTAFIDELEELAVRNHSFKLCNRFGQIDESYVREKVADIAKPIWYIVGPPPMVNAMRDLLSRLGVDDAKIRVEEFIY